MEISPTLATESFSFSWLINHRASFKEETKCFLEEYSSDFSFGVLESSSTTTADEMFSEGRILPKNFIISHSTPSTPSMNAIRIYNTENIQSRNIFREWKKSSKRMMEKLLGYLRYRKGRRVNDSSNSTPRKSMVLYAYDISHDFDSSIYDAVLHCKRSNDI
ncbi:hypothetical protein L1887_41854 [Cichorium endivia]|nr:hypothetical protein L1887_41854 [Cichorium endivia]